MQTKTSPPYILMTFIAWDWEGVTNTDNTKMLITTSKTIKGRHNRAAFL